MFPFGLPSWRGRYRRPEMFCADFMSMVTVCGSGAGVPSNLECQIEAVPASRTLLAGNAVAASLAVAVQPFRGRTGGGTSPSTDSSATEDHGPPVAGSVAAGSRVAPAGTAGR